MKKFLRVILGLVVILPILFFALRSWTKTKSPEAVAKSDQNGVSVQVNYCQPAKKGRTIFAPKAEGVLQPYGEVWRTGANEATIFEVKQDVKVAGKDLKAGKYTLWTIPNEANWTIILNSETGQWGTNYDAKTDVLRVDVPATKTADVVELFKIDFTPNPAGTDMVLRWDNVEVKVPITK